MPTAPYEGGLQKSRNLINNVGINGLKDKWLSRLTPRVLILSDSGTVVPAMLRSGREGYIRSFCLVLKVIPSDFSPLIARP